MRPWILTILIPAAVACGGPIDPPPPTNQDGEEVERPGPFDTWLEVASLAPSSDRISTSPVIRIEFDTWIDDDAFIDFSVVTLRSAGLTVRGRSRWDMTTRSLIFRPSGQLVDGLRYEVRLDGGQLESVTGAPFRSTELRRWRADSSVAPDEPEPVQTASWEEIDVLFEAKCRSCHGDPQWQLNPLTRDSLVGERSEQEDRFLVVPFDPADSYLMHKIIPDYPDRTHTVQPPPWSDAPALSVAEQRRVELWIAGGAR